MNLLPLAEKLETDGVGILADTIFINMIPAECPSGVLLRNKLQGTKIDYELPGYYKAPFQLIARATTYPAGEALMAQATASLTMHETQLGPFYIRFIRPLTKPVVFPLSKGNLLEFAVDFEVVFIE